VSLSIVWVPDFRHEAAGVCDALRSARIRAEKVAEVDVLEEAVAAVRGGNASLALVGAEGLGSLAPEGLVLAAVLPRAEPRDVLLSGHPLHGTLASLPTGSRVGTTGARRAAFLRAHRPDVVAARGWNGGGPAEALDSGAFDALILGATDSRRWGVAHRATEALDAKAWVPAPGQGTAVLLCRAGNTAAVECAAMVDQPGPRAAYDAERAVRASLAPDGDWPLGVLALPFSRWIRVWGMAASRDGAAVVRGDVTGPLDAPGDAGRGLVDLLLARGAASLIGARAHERT
jgi:hydroxymethylbilane synthase